MENSVVVSIQKMLEVLDNLKEDCERDIEKTNLSLSSLVLAAAC